MADFGSISRNWPMILGFAGWVRTKAAVHLALASLTNGLFRSLGQVASVPLWHLLLSLTSNQLVRCLT